MSIAPRESFTGKYVRSATPKKVENYTDEDLKKAKLNIEDAKRILSIAETSGFSEEVKQKAQEELIRAQNKEIQIRKNLDGADINKKMAS
jgi:hypothetical protein